MAAVAALAGIVVGSAAFIRAVAEAADETLVWALPAWWDELGDGSGSWVVAVVAAAVAAVAAACIIVALRQLAPPQAPATVQVGETRVKVVALERLVATRLRAEIPGLVPLRVRVAWTGRGWDVAVLADAPPRDLAGMRARAVVIAGAELARATGASLATLDLEVRRFARSRA